MYRIEIEYRGSKKSVNVETYLDACLYIDAQHNSKDIYAEIWLEDTRVADKPIGSNTRKLFSKLHPNYAYEELR